MDRKGMTILNSWIARLKSKSIATKDVNKNNRNDSDSNNSGAILMKPITVAAITLCIVPMLFVAVYGQSALDTSQAAVNQATGGNGKNHVFYAEEQQRPEPQMQYLQGYSPFSTLSSGSIMPVQDEEEAEAETEPVEPVEPEASTPENAEVITPEQAQAEAQAQAGAELQEVPQNGVTTASPQTGIVTTPPANSQEVQESISGTPLGPEVVNPQINPRAYVPESTMMQDYETILDALKQSGLQFADTGVTYTTEYKAEDMTKIIIECTAGITAQPPSMRLEEIGNAFGYRLDTYTYNPEGQLLVEFEEAF